MGNVEGGERVKRWNVLKLKMRDPGERKNGLEGKRNEGQGREILRSGVAHSPFHLIQASTLGGRKRKGERGREENKFGMWTGRKRNRGKEGKHGKKENRACEEKDRRKEEGRDTEVPQP